MNNVTNLRRAANDNTLRTVAPQQSATVSVQRAMRDGMSPAALMAVVKWNERRGFDERRRKARARLRDQAAALRAVAGEVEGAQMREAA